MPGPHDADDMGALEVALAQGVDHRRSIRGLEQAMGIGGIGVIGGNDAVLAHKGRLAHRLVKALAPVGITIDFAAPPRERAQVFLAHVEELALTADDIKQFARQVHAHALQVGKGYTVDQCCVSVVIHCRYRSIYPGGPPIRHHG